MRIGFILGYAMCIITLIVTWTKIPFLEDFIKNLIDNHPLRLLTTMVVLAIMILITMIYVMDGED